MRGLLDTYTLLRWFSDDPSLSRPARTLETKNDLIVSAASAWKKVRLGKLPTDLTADFVGYSKPEGFELLDISPNHAIRAGRLPAPHQDPFDRMLIAQAQADGFPVVSNDLVFDAYGVRRIW